MAYESMKKHIKPCSCETCEKARYVWACGWCGFHPSFWKTIVESKEWKLWYEEQKRRLSADGEKLFDVDASQECGFMSPEHFKEFLGFIYEKRS